MMTDKTRSESQFEAFWRHALALHGSMSPHVMPNVAIAGLFALLVDALWLFFQQQFQRSLSLQIGPFEFFGTFIGLLLVFRTNAGYDRWWEARKLWGGIVNQSRNLAISGLTYGPDDPQWRDTFRGWVAAFCYAAKASLRGERNVPEFARLIGETAAQRISEADHLPSAVAKGIADLISSAAREHQLDGFAFMQIDRERAALMDHLGGCERILKTPLAMAYSIEIRRFILIFLVTLPFAEVHELGPSWLVPFLTMLVSYALFSLDQLGSELQYPFDRKSLTCLPIDDICATIERNVMSI